MRTQDVDPILEDSLRRIFRCSSDVAQSIGRGAADRTFPVKAVILKQGDRAAVALLLMAGRAHALTCGMDGQLLLLREFLPGDFLGAIAQIESEPETADVVAVEAVRALVFHAMDFLALAESHACVGLALSRALLKQLRAASTKVLAQMTISSVGRIHAELLRLARMNDGRTIRPVPVLTALAVQVHCTRETVSRTINSLERRGLIRREADALFIVAPRRLEEMIV